MKTKSLIAIICGVLWMLNLGPSLQAAGTKAPKEQESDTSYTDQIVIETSIAPADLVGDKGKGDIGKKAKKEEKERDWTAAAGVAVKVKRHMSDGRVVLKLPGRVKADAARRIADRLLADPMVLSAEEDVVVTPEYQPDDPLYPLQSHYLGPDSTLGGANLPEAWDLASGAGVVVAVLDSGITAHEDLVGQTLPGYDFFASDADPTDPDSICNWHGTHIAGTIAAVTNNAKGVTGVARNAKLLPVRVLGNSYGVCQGYLSDIVDAMKWAAGVTPLLDHDNVPVNPNPAKVLNLSFGAQSACNVNYLIQGIDAVIAAGAVVVVAAGNQSFNVQYFLPAGCNNVITVANNQSTGERDPGSNWGALVDISAPGVGIYSTYGNNSYAFKSGTSMAAPHVAGVAALLKEYDPSLTPAELTQSIVGSARPFPTGTGCASGGDYVGLCGAGILDGFGALIYGSPINQPPQVTLSSPTNSSSYIVDEPISFSGSATDVEDGSLTANLQWSSDLEGPLGTGGSFSRDDLRIGSHVISAVVADSQGYSTLATTRITVKAPEVTFVSTGVQDGWVLESGESTNIGGSIKSNDTSNKGLLVGDNKNNAQYKSLLSFDTSSLPDNATIVSARLRIQRGTVSGTSPFDTHGALWADIRSGGFSNNVALEKADFEAPATAAKVASLTKAAANGNWSEGDLNGAGLAAINRTGVTQLRLYFDLDDNNDKGIDYLGYYPGEATAASQPQLVVAYILNAAPAVSISDPADVASFLQGSTISFSGSATDEEDGDLTSTLTWTSNISGPIGTGGSFFGTLPLGTHTITATALDTDGATDSDSITIRVRNDLPTVEITAPAGGDAVFEGQAISFAGWADDLQDGDLTPSIVWSSSLQGEIGTGGSFSRTLSVGTHGITASVTDTDKHIGAATLTVTVEVALPPPPVTDTFKSVGTYDGWVLESGENTNLGGSIKSNDTSSKGLLVGDDRNNNQYKTIVSFDTSSIPDSATIESVTLRIQRGGASGTNPFDTHGILWADIRSGGFNDSLALEAADFQAPATAYQVASLSNAAANNDWSQGILNAAGLAAVNKTGVTQLRLYFSLDDNNDKGVDYLGYYPGDYSTDANRPQLVVTYRQ